jgi:hypothetical protein
LVGGSLLSFAVLGGVAFGLNKHQSRRSTPPVIMPRHSTAASSAAAGAPALANVFGVLAQPRRASDSLGTAASGQDIRAGLAVHGVDPAQARLMRSVSGWGAWLVPGDGVVCLHASPMTNAAGGSACPFASQGADGFNLTISGGAGGADAIPAGSVLVAGVVPDGVRTVQVAFKNGDEQTLNVTRNAYMAVLADNAVSVSYTDANGPQVRLVASCGAC